MGCTRLNQTRHGEDNGSTHATVHLVLLCLGLLFDHKEGMIEEEDDQLGTVTLSAAPLLQRTFVYKLAAFLL